jgi:hypothetical protein
MDKKKGKQMLKKKQRQRLYRQARKTKKWSNYRSYQKECKRHLRKAEYEYINQNIFEGLKNNNTKPFWNQNDKMQEELHLWKREQTWSPTSKGKQNSY